MDGVIMFAVNDVMTGRGEMPQVLEPSMSC